MKFLTVFLMMFLTFPALAEAPLPPKKADSLAALKEKVQTEKERQKELSQKAETLEKDLGEIKSSLVRTAREVQRNEKAMQLLEQQIAELKKKKTALNDSLETDRASLSSLIIAMERIRRLPPETLIARPGAPRETAQAATALQAILPELNNRAEDLRKKLEELTAVEEELTDNQLELKTASAELKSEKEKMDTQLSARARIFSKTQQDAKAQQRAVETASREAADFEDLIRKIEEKNRELEKEQARQAAKDAARPAKKSSSRKQPDERKLAATLPSLGSAKLPVSGIVKIRYGQEDDIGAISKGIRIESRSGAIVVAPLGGTVRYAGAFKAYGNIILLEHKNNYHSLIAGLGRIDTFVGQNVGSGEPIGSLGSQSRPSIYYELRLNGQPIDPARKFSDLGT